MGKLNEKRIELHNPYPVRKNEVIDFIERSGRLIYTATDDKTIQLYIYSNGNERPEAFAEVEVVSVGYILHGAEGYDYQGTSLKEFENDLRDVITYFDFITSKRFGESNKEQLFNDILNEADETYKAKVQGKWLKGNKLVKDEKDADTFESKTEPTQRINQMKKDGKLNKNAKPSVIKEAATTKYMACCYDPEDYYEETNYVDEDGELNCNSSGAKLFDTEDEAIDYADDNKPYGWVSFAMPYSTSEVSKLLTESLDQTSAAFNLTKLKGYLRFETTWEHDGKHFEDAMLVDKVHDPARFTVKWIGPDAEKHPNTYCVNIRKDFHQVEWETHYCLKASDAAELINLEVGTWEHNNMSWKFESKEQLFDRLLEFFFYAPPHHEEDEEDTIIGYVAAVRDYQVQKTKYIDDDGNVCNSKSQAKVFDTKGKADYYSYEHCPEGWTHFVVPLKKSDILNEAVEDFPKNTRAMYRFAKRRHDDTGAIRKVSKQPYWVHPEGVAKIVMEHGGSDVEIKAAMAHDVLEDTGESYEDMAEKFGDKVASIVKEVTNDKDEIAKVGKEKYISEELCCLSPEALTVKLADMLYNMKDSPTEKNYERMRKNIAFLMMNRHLDGKHLELAQEIMEV